MTFSRAYDRSPESLRPIRFEIQPIPHAEGSCWVDYGQTRVLCTATVDDFVPHFVKSQGGNGWITAEYGMLPRATLSRNGREAVQGGQKGRTQEIQRLIGRALRAAVNLEHMGSFQIKIDCDVIQADGGTRTAAISGAYIALSLALKRMGQRAFSALQYQVAAVSAGIVQGVPLLDLDYIEDSRADVDGNFVFVSSWPSDQPNQMAEIQASGEKKMFSFQQLQILGEFAQKGCQEIFALQRKALGL
jgi:ribonuclease PH